MRIRKSFAVGIAAIALTASATSCSTTAPGADDGGNAGKQTESNVLRLNYGEGPYSTAVLEAFKADHPEIKVQVTHATLTFEDGSVQTNLRSGKGADVLLVNSGPGRVAPLADAGLIADLTKVYDQGAREQYPQNVLDQIDNNGKIYEVVEGRDIFQLHYNEKLFEAAGVEPPTTWSELLATCKPLAESGVQPLVVGARDNFMGGWLLGTLVQSSAGSELMQGAIFGDSSFTQQPIVDGANKLRQLIDKGCVDGKQGLALEGDEASAAFGQRKAAMIVGTQALVSDLEEDKLDASGVKAIPMPSDDPADEHPTSGLAVSWVVNARSASPATTAWIEWVSSAEYLQLAAENGYTFAPAHEVPDSVDLDPTIAEAVDRANAETGLNPSVYLSADAKEAWYAAVQGLLAGQDPKPLLTAVDDAIKNDAGGQ
jgi:raffinose/stachyose/melibiose transport system substrate-binding protein